MSLSVISSLLPPSSCSFAKVTPENCYNDKFVNKLKETEEIGSPLQNYMSISKAS